MGDETFELSPGRLTIAEVRRLSEPGAKIALDAAGRKAVEAALAIVNRMVDENQRVYGINTGMGSLSDSIIADDQLSELQHRLVLSNAAGTGVLLSDRLVRRIMLLKLNTLGQANSGVRLALVDQLIGLFNGGVQPCIPSKGSVGASGDLAPLAHLAVALIGVGDVRLDGATLTAADALEHLGLAPLVLAPKEGLAMVNGTQVSLALALEGLFAFDDVAVAMLEEVGDKCADPMDDSPQVNVEHPMPVLNSQLVWREAGGSSDASVVANKVGSVEAIDGQREQSLYI